jgi:predicted MPP superfamily phosphohydrolase
VRFRGPFRALRAPLGTWAVLGNHDHYTGELPALREELHAAGIGLLQDAWTPIEAAGAAFTLAGVDDLLLGQPDLDRALDGAPAPLVLLSHNPDLLFEAARRGVALMLSGHTHAGQVRIPRLPVLVRQSRYRLDEGRYRAGATELIVSRGLGAVGLPWRVACPPEGVLIRLRAQRGVS